MKILNQMSETKPITLYEANADQIHPTLRRDLTTSGTVAGPIVMYDKATSEQIHSLLTELEDVKQRITDLEKEVGTWDAIDVRDLDEEEAKREIKAYFEACHEATLYPDEIAKALSLDVLQVIRLCRELEIGGEIAEA